MADVGVDLAEKKAVAWALDWPGWCRVGRGEEEALRALAAYEARYRPIAERAGLAFAPGALTVVERAPGDFGTAFGVPSVTTAADARPLDTAAARRMVALLRAAWDALDEGVATAPAALRKGPRGGGRDRDAVWGHVVEAERAYARKVGVRHPPFAPADREAVRALRAEVAAALDRPGDGAPLITGGWTARYAARRVAWHVLDHLWEIEDRAE